MWGKNKDKKEHEHDYEVVIDSHNEKSPEGEWKTHIMLSCKCGVGWINTIKGKWTKVKIKEWYKVGEGI